MASSINIVDSETKELIASIGEDDVIIKDGYEVVEVEEGD